VIADTTDTFDSPFETVPTPESTPTDGLSGRSLNPTRARNDIRSRNRNDEGERIQAAGDLNEQLGTMIAPTPKAASRRRPRDAEFLSGDELRRHSAEEARDASAMRNTRPLLKPKRNPQSMLFESTASIFRTLAGIDKETYERDYEALIGRTTFRLANAVGTSTRPLFDLANVIGAYGPPPPLQEPNAQPRTRALRAEGGANNVTDEQKSYDGIWEPGTYSDSTTVANDFAEWQRLTRDDPEFRYLRIPNVYNAYKNWRQRRMDRSISFKYYLSQMPQFLHAVAGTKKARRRG
jgi:hypothetical protein